MLTSLNLHNYQNDIVTHIKDNDNSMLFVNMGLGKTPSTLKAIVDLQDELKIGSVLVIAPLRIIQSVWQQEAKKWAFSKHLTFSLIHGKYKESALNKEADIYLINPEAMVWLSERLDEVYFNRGKPIPFDTLVIDEISKFKNSSSKRFKAFKTFFLNFNRRIGLTGTPASNGLINLFGEFMCIDAGERLGKTKYAFTNKFFNKSGYMGYGLETKDGAEDYIHKIISDITYELSLEDAGLELPPVVFNDIYIDLPPSIRTLYNKMEKEFFVKLDNDKEIDAPNAAAMTMKLRQLCNGSVYDDRELMTWSKVHDKKLDVLEEIIEESEGSPVLLFYQFIHDRERILVKYPKAVFFKAGMSASVTEDIISRWNDNKIELLVASPFSTGHGLNLQYAKKAMMVWFGLGFSLEVYLQANARIARQGNTTTTVIHRIMSNDTIELCVRDALENKATTEKELIQAIRTYRRMLK